MWGKFYAAMYSLAYFETDIVTVMEKAKATLPVGSYPRKIYDAAFEAYAQNPDATARRAWKFTTCTATFIAWTTFRPTPTSTAGSRC